jgi:hypothetical protein
MVLLSRWRRKAFWAFDRAKGISARRTVAWQSKPSGLYAVKADGSSMNRAEIGGRKDRG